MLHNNLNNLNYYEILRVDDDASLEEIKTAFRREAKRYHPDRNIGDKEAEEIFKTVNKAYSVLSDKNKRSEYDKRLFGTQKPGKSSVIKNIFASEKDLNKENAKKRRNERTGKNIHQEINVTFEEAVNGCKKRINITRYEKCPKCDGDRRCKFCKGTGRVRKTQILCVSIPAGIGDTQVITMVGYGDAGENGGENGDLLLKVNIEPHTFFKRKGFNVVISHEISVFTALLGGYEIVPTIKGDEGINIKAGTQPDERIIIKGAGIPYEDIHGVKHFGDQEVIVKVKIPNNLNNRVIRCLENAVKEFE